MVYKSDTWKAAVKKVVGDLKTDSASQGKVCAIATLRYLRDELITEIWGSEPDIVKTGDEAVVATVREAFKTLITSVSKDGAKDGFASNASAAAKSAGFKGTSATEVELVD